MDPLLLVCGGCGAKIRATDPARARTRGCPRCSTPLAPAVAEALRLWSENRPHMLPDEVASRRLGAEASRTVARFPAKSAPARWRVPALFAGAATLLGSSLVHLWDSARVVPSHSSVEVARSQQRPPARDSQPPAPIFRPMFPSHPDPVPDLDLEPLDLIQVEEVEAVVQPEPPRPASLPVSSLALRDPQEPGSEPRVPPPPVPAGPAKLGSAGSGKSPASPKPPLIPAPDQPRRLLVRDASGKAVVAREHGMLKDQMAVVLPDGTIGWPTTQVFTEDPFVPSTIDALEQTLHDGEYATFRVIKTAHYLVFYQSSERFARDSADLLEKLYERLSGALRKQKIPVTDAEFPLVAVIFRSEDDFRANREIAREVQAYYEILSNRIFFYEKGKRDSAAPEVSAFRKPQTVAHEGTHQILHNIGVQPRMSPWPIWFVEGLAEYCSPPRSSKKGGLTWDGLGQVNPIHLATIRDLDDPMAGEVRGGPRPPSARDRGQPLVEYLATRFELTPTDYALSWGLAHYLAVERVEQFVAYIRKLNQLEPFETRSPEEQLADFREVFGENLGKLDAQVARHLSRLKVPDAQALPFYAVMVEQPVTVNAVRRMAMVSQSPSVIRQWFDTISNASGGHVGWNVVPYPNRTRAMLAADSWIQQGR